jgi:hypothetical protein
MARLRTPTSIVSLALKMRTEGTGVRASGRVLDKSHATIMRWENELPIKNGTGLVRHQWEGMSQLKGMKSTLALAVNLPPL